MSLSLQPLVSESIRSALAGALPGPQRVALLCAAALLAACSSTPLPPWPDASRPTPSGKPAKGVVVAPQARVPVVAPPLGAPARVAPGGVSITPVAPATPLILDDDDAGTTLDSAAVVARFPDPATRYDTPGLAEGRRTFTTNAELSSWLHQLAARPPGGGTRLAVLNIGASQRGMPLEALLATRAAGTDLASLDASKRPTVLLIGQQHGDEPAGSEALLVIARELAPGGLLEPLLDRINVIVLPRANPDGAATGQRATANGVDMNRDHLLLSTPEARALAVVARDYRPIAVIDAHEFTVAGRYLQKFGGVQRADAMLQYATTANMPEFITKAAREWYHAPMVNALQAQGLTHEWYYTTSSDLQDLRVSMGGVEADTGRNVNGLKNAVSLLVETRGLGIGRAHLQRRVHTQVTAITAALRSTAERTANLEKVRSYVVREIASQACRGDVVVQAGATPSQRELTLIDPQTGADRVVSVAWNSALELRTLKSRPRPCGYWIAASAGDAVERLKLLGVQVLRVAENGSVLADTWRETHRTLAPRADVRGVVADRQDAVQVQVSTVRSAIDAPAGSYYVPLNQPLSNLVVAALEPDTQSSYFANHVMGSLSESARVMATPSLLFEEID